MTGPLADFFDEIERTAALNWPDLGDGPEALAERRAAVDAMNGPTVEVMRYRPFQGNAARATEVWAVVDRNQAARLVTPAPMTDPALRDRDEPPRR